VLHTGSPICDYPGLYSFTVKDFVLLTDVLRLIAFFSFDDYYQIRFPMAPRVILMGDFPFSLANPREAFPYPRERHSPTALVIESVGHK